MSKSSAKMVPAEVRAVRMAALERRERLVQAALRVIARDGVAAATTRAIVAEADMPPASFHYVFQSRDELIAELIHYVVDNEDSAALAADALAGEGVEQ